MVGLHHVAGSANFALGLTVGRDSRAVSISVRSSFAGACAPIDSPVPDRLSQSRECDPAETVRWTSSYDSRRAGSSGSTRTTILRFMIVRGRGTERLLLRTTSHKQVHG